MSASNPSSTNAELQRRIDSVHWYHEFDFGGGLVAKVKTPDAASHRALWRFIEDSLNKIDFAGKTVLDIGCWDGYWSFYAEKRGAKQVLATDDSSQNWAGEAGFILAKELLSSRVESNLRLSVYDLDKLDREFDVILCLGVYYHLIDPFYAFTEIRHRCHDDSMVIIEGDAFFGLIETPAQSAALYSRDLRQAPRFVPDPNTLRFLINSAYFDIIAEAVLPLSNSAGAHLTGVHRMLMVCRPARKTNQCHVYQPPFGLIKYDDRKNFPSQKWSEQLAASATEPVLERSGETKLAESAANDEITPLADRGRWRKLGPLRELLRRMSGH